MLASEPSAVVLTLAFGTGVASGLLVREVAGTIIRAARFIRRVVRELRRADHAAELKATFESPAGSGTSRTPTLRH